MIWQVKGDRGDDKGLGLTNFFLCVKPAKMGRGTWKSCVEYYETPPRRKKNPFSKAKWRVMGDGGWTRLNTGNDNPVLCMGP